MRKALQFVRLAKLALGGLAMLGFSAQAQEFPTKPPRMVVPLPPGGAADVVARIIAPEMGKALGQTVVVENKPGAENKLGFEYVVSQPADGYNMVLVNVSNMAGMPVLFKELSFDPAKDLPPFVALVDVPSFFAVSTKNSWQTLGEMLAHAKANPGKLNYATSGVFVRLFIEAVLQPNGVSIVPVNYAGGPQNLQAISTNEVQIALMVGSQLTSLGDKVRALAVTGDRRTAAFPTVPTFRELGYPQIPGNNYTLNLRRATPKAVVDRLTAAAQQALRDPEVKAQYAKSQFEIASATPADAARMQEERIRLFTDIANKIGLKPQ